MSLGPPGKVGVLRARVGGGLAVPRVTAVQVGGDDERAVCREPSREAASAGGAPAGRVGGNHDRVLSLGVADEVGADDPSLRNAGEMGRGNGGEVSRGKDRTREDVVGDDDDGWGREGAGREASSRAAVEKMRRRGALVGSRVRWSDAARTSSSTAKPTSRPTSFFSEDSSSDITSFEPFVRRATGCGWGPAAAYRAGGNNPEVMWTTDGDELCSPSGQR